MGEVPLQSILPKKFAQVSELSNKHWKYEAPVAALAHLERACVCVCGQLSAVHLVATSSQIFPTAARARLAPGMV